MPYVGNVVLCATLDCLSRPSPHTNLGSLTALSEMYIPDGQNLFISGADIKDCFYAVRVDDALSDFFGLMQDITGDEVYRATGGECGEMYSDDMFTPAVSVLPMGFSWSFYLVQCIHEHSVCRALDIGREQLVLEGFPAPLLSGGECVAMPYCDNAHVLSFCEDLCNAGSLAAQSDLTSLGFTTHEEEQANTFFKTLGGVVDGVAGEVRTTPERVWLLIFAFEHIAYHKVHPDVVQRLLGHAMVVCTINRYGMCIFRHLYDFVEQGGSQRFLNLQARNECLNFLGIIPMLFASMRRPWCTTINCTDASPIGYGICQSEVDGERVQNIGRWQERWRYKRLPPAEWAPRRRALGLDVFGSVSTVVGSSNCDFGLEHVVDNEIFPEVPVEILHPKLWKTKKFGRWGNTSEHITIKEGRALVLAVRRLCRASKNRGKRHLFLVDNLGLVLAINKGRAHNVALLRITQQVSALALAGGFSVRVRWVPSELNVADGPSRGQIKPGCFKKAACESAFNNSYEGVAPYGEKNSDWQANYQMFEQKGFECGSKNESTEDIKEESACWERGEDSRSHEEANHSTPTHQGRGRRGEACETEQADLVGGEECLQRSSASIWSALEEVREISAGRKAPAGHQTGATSF